VGRQLGLGKDMALSKEDSSYLTSGGSSEDSASATKYLIVGKENGFFLSVETREKMLDRTKKKGKKDNCPQKKIEHGWEAEAEKRCGDGME